MPGQFRTQYEPSVSVSQPVGDPVKIMYGPKYRADGTWYLVQIGKHDLYSEIQSHAGSVDIHEILRRFATGQDPAALSRIQGVYGDFTQMPKTFAEALNTLVAAQQYFMDLPKDTRAEFGHDFNRFIASFDSPDFLAKSGLFDVPSPDPNNLPAPGTPVSSSSSSAPSSSSSPSPSFASPSPPAVS